MTDLFQTRSMLRALEIQHTPKTFLLDTFFPEVDFSQTKTVEIDVMKGKRKLAPFVNPLHQGVISERTRYSVREIAPPYIKVKRSTDAADLVERELGENPFSGRSPMQRAASILNRDLRELTEEIVRREEWMAAQLLFGGQMTLVGEGYDAVVIDMQMDAENIFTTGELVATWDNLSTARPLEDLRNMQRVAIKKTGKTPRDVVMSVDVYEVFKRTNQVIDELNIRRITGAERPSLGAADGPQLEMTINGVNIWTYEEYYDDEAGTVTSLIPAKKLFMAPRNLRAVRHYGAIRDLSIPGGQASLRWWPKSWLEEDPSVRLLMLQSAPLPVIHEIDGLVNATVLP